MKYFKLIISYDGSNYKGWQIQKGQSYTTVQGHLTKVLKEICQSENVKTIGSGRTDTAVHAIGQVVKVEIPIEIEASSLQKALNSRLNQDIKVLSSVQCSEDFHPTFDAISKEYWYLFSPNLLSNPFMRNYVSIYPYEMNFELIQRALEILEGEHDFCNYFNTGTPTSSTIRTIYNAKLSNYEFPPPFHLQENIYLLSFRGNGFLKQMIRLLVGAIWSVGRGKISLTEFEESLRVKQDKKLALCAPATGLYLKEVQYPS